MSYRETPAQWASMEKLFKRGFHVSRTQADGDGATGKAVVMSKRQENWLGLVFKTVEPDGKVH